MHNASTAHFEVLLTAGEAYPAFEQQFLMAQDEVLASFRVFDPWTKLRSDAAKLVGDTWFDLITDTLNRGARISLIISDFDPVVGRDLHHDSWRSVRGLIAAGEVSDHPELLQVRASLHPARVGLLPRFLLWPRLLKEIRSSLAQINTGTRADKETFLTENPKLGPLVKWQRDKLVPRLAPPPLVPVTHHQKFAVFDRKTLYIGGLDLNDRRYDTPAHQRDARQTWHDLQILTNGPVVQEAADHFLSFEATTHGGPVRRNKHLLRTISAKRAVSLPFLSPKSVVRELAEAHQVQIAGAKQLIYLETQFFRDRNLANQLAKRAGENPELSLILIVPAAPEEAIINAEPSSDVAYGEHLQVACLEIITEAFGDRAFIGSPAQPRAVAPDGRATHYGAPIVYLHAKVALFDDTCAIVSSANLNGRSMFWDTEAGIALHKADEVALLKQRCFAHWLDADADEALYDLSTARAAWAKRANANAQRPPDQRSGFILPHRAAPAAALARNLPGVPEEMV